MHERPGRTAALIKAYDILNAIELQDPNKGSVVLPPTKLN